MGSALAGLSSRKNVRQGRRTPNRGGGKNEPNPISLFVGLDEFYIFFFDVG
jgi:hypothetical protein